MARVINEIDTAETLFGIRDEKHIIQKTELTEKLENKFGNLTNKFVFYKENVKYIFNVLNEFIFQKKLQYPKIVIDTLENINNMYKKSCQKFSCQYSPLTDNIVALFHVILINSDEELENIKDVSQLKFENQHIFIMSDSKHVKTIYDFVNAFCHELIHYYDYEFGQLKNIYLLNTNSNEQSFDSHNSGTFQKKMKLANELGLNVVTVINEDLNKKSDMIFLKQKEGKFTVIVHIN